MNLVYSFLIIFAFFILGYLFGSIPNSIIIGKIYRKDPREYGSKNPGGTNVGRVISHFAGALTILLDVLKILLPFIGAYFLVTYFEPLKIIFEGNSNFLVYNWYGFGTSLSQLSYYIVPLGGFIGHSFSCFLKFKGGKIVSTFVALMIGTSYLAIPIFIVIFFITLKITKHVSLSSIVMSLAYTLFSWIVYFIFLGTNCNDIIASYMMWFNFGPTISIYYPIITTLGCIILIIRHKQNIIRLINGTESKVTWIDNIFKKNK